MKRSARLVISGAMNQPQSGERGRSCSQRRLRRSLIAERQTPDARCREFVEPGAEARFAGHCRVGDDRRGRVAARTEPLCERQPLFRESPRRRIERHAPRIDAGEDREMRRHGPRRRRPRLVIRDRAAREAREVGQPHGVVVTRRVEEDPPRSPCEGMRQSA